MTLPLFLLNIQLKYYIYCFQASPTCEFNSITYLLLYNDFFFKFSPAVYLNIFNKMNKVSQKEAYCTRCSLQFGSVAVFDMHLSLHKQNEIQENLVCRSEQKMTKGKKSFSCEICKKLFSSKQSLKKHISSVHEAKKSLECKLVRCDLGDRDFSSKRNLHQHVKLTHDIKCKICESGFGTRRDLIRHVASVHEGKEYFECKICTKGFNSNMDLSRHLKFVHDKSKTFKCGICDSAFTQPFDVKRHIKEVHEEIKTFKCGICYSAFTLPCYVKRHIKEVHEGKKPQSTKKMQRKKTIKFLAPSVSNIQIEPNCR